MTYVALVLLAACIVLGFFLYVALVGHADLPLAEALGMLRLAEDTLIRERMGEDE